MTMKPDSKYYNPQTKELQDTVPIGEHEAVRKELRTTRYYLTNARAENATLKREIKRMRALAARILNDQPTE